MDRETELREQLVKLQLEYNERAKPIVAELIEIETRKPPAPIVIMASDIREAVLRSLFDRAGNDVCQCEQCQAVRAMNAERKGKLN